MDISTSSVLFDITFHNFNDVSGFLGIKEDDDYERVIYKAFQSQTSHNTALLGSRIHCKEQNQSISNILIGYSGKFDIFCGFHCDDQKMSKCIPLKKRKKENLETNISSAFWLNRNLPLFQFVLFIRTVM